MGRLCWEVCAAVLLVVLWGALSSPSCPAPCLCQGESLINCSFVGPSLAPLRPPVSVTTLDLSHNQLSSITPLIPLPRLTHLYVGHNQLTHLSLCGGCREGQSETWAPSLELLSAERNQLQRIPECLGEAAFLHVLHLSHNKIRTLRPQDLQGCANLKELHLQHNLISTLHHLAFRELQELKILDLRFNALNTIPTPAFLSLRSLNVQVDVSGNPWRCDCRLLGVRRAMGVDRDGPHPPWLMMCEEPSHVAGRNLLHLDDMDLTCDTPAEGTESLQEVTVHLGGEILLPCSISDQGNDLSQAYWWTPAGSSTQHRGGLLIREIRERDEGLYVCVWGTNQEPASMFAVRVRRSPGGPEPAAGSREKTSSELALAVCLSVFLTFIAAFALGALARPLLDILWGKICARRHPSATPTPTAYENQAGPDEVEGPRGSGALGEAGRPYYITVLPESARSHVPPDHTGERGMSTYEDVPPMGGASRNRGDKSGSSSEEEAPHPVRTVEFEPIPDPQDLGIEDCSTTGSNQSNHNFDSDLGPDHDLGPNLGPDCERGQSPCPLPVSKEEFMASWSNSTRLPGMEPFPVPDWAESPWEPCPSAAQATPSHVAPSADGLPSALWDQPDPELWNDSGESFEFADSLKDGCARASDQDLSPFSLAQQLKDGPWSPFGQSAAGEWDPGNNPAGPWVEEGGFPTSPFGADPLPEFSRSEQRSSSSSESSEEPTEYTPNPEITAPNPEITAPNPEITALNPEITAPNPEITALNPEITALNTEITALNPEITALNPEITALNPEITANHRTLKSQH
ncbi:hypothetical protein AAFF_G00437810 [Aldrovandia affinis]|uniref:Ig-like domain-containing protein n=1 Tax=Aldrovandia affinis TaxID=143900 RepID=A0AAD7S7Q3_9TELE|nr:hypothetical protein AAFF_G00437810 [Aldrovandia affinis]